jgi:hypothetical protein
MITSVAAMQNAILAQNMATSNMMGAANAMLSTVAFGNSQPLRPSFAQSADVFELQMKANETKMSVYQKMVEALEKSIGQSIKRSTPHFGGLDYKA